MSGLCAGAKLLQAGVPFTILESGTDIQYIANIYRNCIT